MLQNNMKFFCLLIINKLYKTFLVEKSFHIVKGSVRPFYDYRTAPVRWWSHEAKISSYGPRTIKFLTEPQIF